MDEFLEMWPEKFFADVFFSATLHANNANVFGKPFYRKAIIFVDMFVIDESGDKINLRNVIMISQCLCEFQDVFDLASCVGVPTKFGGIFPVSGHAC